MRSAFALRIISGKNILFVVPKRLRAFWNYFFTGGAEPSPSSLRDATSPERGRFIRADRKMPKSSPFGEAGCDQREQTERVCPP